MTLTQNPILEFIESLIKDLNFLLSDPIQFFDKYFFSAPGYNLYNTITYTIIGILAIGLIGKIIQIINKKGVDRWGKEDFIPVRMDSEFFVAILPYIFIGSTLRALQDIAIKGGILFPYQIFADRMFVTPGVYIITIILTLSLGIISIFISQEYLRELKPVSNWRVTFLIVGVIVEIFLFIPILLLLLTGSDTLIGGFAIITLTITFGIGFYFISKYVSIRYFPKTPIRVEEVLAMITQMFDAFNTVIAIEFFNYQEKHYLPAILFNTPLGSWPFLLIKFLIVLFFFWALRGFENRNIERWLLWVVFLLGLATGTRDFLRLITNT